MERSDDLGARAGRQFGQGMVEGIRSKEDEVYAAGQALARAAARGANNAGSPSVHLFSDAGAEQGEAYAMGLVDAGNSADEAAKQLAASAARMLKNAELGINRGYVVPPGYVSPPVGVRSSALWTQEMVDAWESGGSVTQSGDMGASAAARDTGGPSAAFDAAVAFRDLNASITHSIEIEAGILSALEAPIIVEVSKMPPQRPTVEIGEIRVEVAVTGTGTPEDVRTAAAAGLNDALDAPLDGLSIREMTAVIGAL